MARVAVNQLGSLVVALAWSSHSQVVVPRTGPTTVWSHTVLQSEARDEHDIHHTTLERKKSEKYEHVKNFVMVIFDSE